MSLKFLKVCSLVIMSVSSLQFIFGFGFFWETLHATSVRGLLLCEVCFVKPYGVIVSSERMKNIRLGCKPYKLENGAARGA